MKKVLSLLTVLVIGLNIQAFAQHRKINSSTNQNHLNSIAREYGNQFQRAKSQAVQFAKERNWPIRLKADSANIELLQLSANGMPVYVSTDNVDAARVINTDRLWPGGILNYDLTGQGYTIGEWDGGAVRTTHQEFGGRVVQADSSHYPVLHATHVAGTMVAAGVDFQARGMANNAHLDAYDWDNDAAEMAKAAGDGLMVSNHSYSIVAGWKYGDFQGLGHQDWYWFGDPSISEKEDYHFGFYDDKSRKWDDIAHNAPYYLIVKAAGNEHGTGPAAGTTHYVWQDTAWVESSKTREISGGSDGFDTIAGASLAKNVLTIGSIQDIHVGYYDSVAYEISDFSSWGPTDDGRIKPDLVTNGESVYSTSAFSDDSYATMSGTSMASPGAAGSLLLLQQLNESEKGSPLTSSSLKALAIETADDAGIPGPDYKYGWGVLNTAKAARFIHSTSGRQQIVEDSLKNGASYEQTIHSDGNSPVKITLAWNDLPGSPVAPALNPRDRMLVQDLDLRLVNISSGTEYKPYVLDPVQPELAATNADNDRDNVEQVYLKTPVAGDYKVKVTHKGQLSETQSFSLVISTRELQTQEAGYLFDEATFPFHGTNQDEYEFQITYMRKPADGPAPDSVKLFLEGQTYSMNKGMSYADGKIYYDNKQIGKLSAGDLSYHYEAYVSGRKVRYPYDTELKVHVDLYDPNSVWHRVSSGPLNHYVESMEIDTGGTVFAGDFKGDIYRSQDRGSTWQQMNYNGLRAQTITVDSTGRLYVAGNSSLYKSDDQGLTFTKVKDFDIWIGKIIIDDNGDMYLLGMDGAYYLSRDGGNSWNKVNVPVSASGIELQDLYIDNSDSSKTMYLSTWGDGLFKSDDGGTNWQSMNSPQRYNYTLIKSQGGKLVLGTIYGLYVSSDSGATWQAKTNKSGTVQQSKIIDFAIKADGTIYGSSYGCHGPGNGVFVSLDDAETWTEANDGLTENSIRILEVGPQQHVYAAVGYSDITYGGGIFKTETQKLHDYTIQAMQAPAAVDLVFPYNGATDMGVNPKLTWYRSEQAQTYRVQISESSDFSSTVLDSSGISDTTFTASNLDYNTSYYWRVKSVYQSYESDWSQPYSFGTGTTTAIGKGNDLPDTYSLDQNYPNPFNPTTVIKYALPEASRVHLAVYNILGRKVAVLANEKQSAGYHTIQFNATRLSSGFYFYRIKAGDFVKTRKMLLIK